MKFRHWIEGRICGINVSFETYHVDFWFWVLEHLAFGDDDYISQQLIELTHNNGVSERYPRLKTEDKIWKIHL